MTDETTHLQSHIAGLADDDASLISGVAIGAGDITRGMSGDRKLWPADELQQAADSLIGTPLTVDHSDSARDVVGEVVAAAFEEGVGVVYEAELDDEAIANKVANGRLDVSIEARHRDGGHDEDADAMVATDVEFTGLSVVQRGAAPSNSAAAGPNEAVASLSAADIHATLAGEQSPASDDPTGARSSSRDADSGTSDDGETADPTDSLSTKSDMTDETEGSEADEAEDPTTTDEQLQATKADLADARERISALEAENEKLREERETVALAYAEALADEDSVFTAEDLAERFEVSELREKYDENTEAELAATPDPEPDVQSGSGGAETESASLSEEESEEAELLKEQIRKLEGRGWDAAAQGKREKLADLTGQDAESIEVTN